jgi:hypothetical protein
MVKYYHYDIRKAEGGSWMLAELIKSSELLHFDELTGFPILGHNHRCLIIVVAALVRLRDDLITSVGMERASVIMTRYGYQTGIETAMKMAELYEFDTLEEWFYAGIRMQSMSGMANTEISELEIDKESKSM